MESVFYVIRSNCFSSSQLSFVHFCIGAPSQIEVPCGLDTGNSGILPF